MVVCVPSHENLENGYVICEHPADGLVFFDPMKLGTVCTFGCTDGFELLGSETTECQQDFGPLGAWSNDAPICQSGYQPDATLPYLLNV